MPVGKVHISRCQLGTAGRYRSTDASLSCVKDFKVLNDFTAICALVELEMANHGKKILFKIMK